jgi:molybdopterin synthase catalytic subunit
MHHLTREPIDYHALTESVRSPRCGAVALFLGTVRELTGEQVTVFLDYEAYAPMAEKKMAEIEAEVRRKWPVEKVAMVHRLGRLEVGEVSVAVAVSSLHRTAAFEACRYAIDTIKQLVPIWKKENAPDGTGEWVHQSESSNVNPTLDRVTSGDRT